MSSPSHGPFVPMAPVRAHILALQGAGAKSSQIAAAADLEPEVVYYLRSSTRGSVYAPVAAAVLRVTVEEALAAPMRDRVPATGTRRRVQALYHLGWSIESMADQSGVDIRELRNVLRARSTALATAVAVDELHRRLWATPPRPRGVDDAAAIRRRRQRARRLGYVATLAWDDIDADAAPADPPADPEPDAIAVELAIAGERIELRRCERSLVARGRRRAA